MRSTLTEHGATATPRPRWSSTRLTPPPGLRAGLLLASEDEFLLLEWPIAARTPPAGLTMAEQGVAMLLLAGLSNAEIARRREVSVRTVCNQVASLFSKLEVGSRSELFALVARGARATEGPGT